MAILYPFIASNRDFKKPVQDDYPFITTDGSLSYLDSTPPYDQTKPIDYNTWIKKILASIPAGRVMIFIHGFANPWSKVTDTTDTGLAGMVSHFSNSPSRVTTPYLWPIILFDWPSYFAEKMPPCSSYYSAKANATNTAKLSFGQLRKIIDDIQSAKPGTKVDIVCHSMGNFVLQQSMQAGAQPLTPNSVSTFLLNAAALADDSFVKGSTKTPATDITKYLTPKGSAHVHWSQHDDVLPAGEICDRYRELGVRGPASGSIGIKNHDLSSIITRPPKGGAPSVHVSYYYIKEVLDQMIALMLSQTTDSSSLRRESESVHGSS